MKEVEEEKEGGGEMVVRTTGSGSGPELTEKGQLDFSIRNKGGCLLEWSSGRGQSSMTQTDKLQTTMDSFNRAASLGNCTDNPSSIHHPPGGD